MLRRLILKMLGLAPVQQKLDRRPYVVVRRDVAEKWTDADGRWLAEVMASPRWAKMLRFSDDAICADVLAPNQDPEFVRALVAGRMRERDYQARLAQMVLKPPEVDQERAVDPSLKSTGVDRVSMQMDEEEQ
jgi:hypothetical protein